MMRFKVIVSDSCTILFIASLVCASCVKHQSIGVLPPQNSPKSEVSFKFLPEPDSGEGKDTQGWEYHPPRIIGDAVHPVYPERALAAGVGYAILVVRIHVGPDGTITDLMLSPGSKPGPFSEDFLHEIEIAVKKWKFTRPERWQLEEGRDLNGDGKIDCQKVLRIVPVSAIGDVEFSFNIAVK
jgi:hypothetical protein